MRQGTTPKHTFNLPFDLDLVEKIKVTYGQNNRVVLEKHIDTEGMLGMTVEYTLTQEDTFKFDSNSNVKIQMRVKMKDGRVISTDLIHKPVEECLDSEVL